MGLSYHNIQLDDDLVQEMKDLAAKESKRLDARVSFAGLVRRAMRAYIEERKKDV